MRPGLKSVIVILVVRFVNIQESLTVLVLHLVSCHLFVVFDHISSVYGAFFIAGIWDARVIVSKLLEINRGVAEKM